MIAPTEKESANYHATVVELNGAGVMIEGMSGSGKTSLAMGLIEMCQRNGGSAILISDDQVLLEATFDNKLKLLAHRPETIAGMIEIRGYGVAKIASKNSTEIDLVVRLVPDESIERFPEAQTCVVNDVCIPMIRAPIRHEALGIRIVSAKLTEMSTHC